MNDPDADLNLTRVAKNSSKTNEVFRSVPEVFPMGTVRNTSVPGAVRDSSELSLVGACSRAVTRDVVCTCTVHNAARACRCTQNSGPASARDRLLCRAVRVAPAFARETHRHRGHTSCFRDARRDRGVCRSAGGTSHSQRKTNSFGSNRVWDAKAIVDHRQPQGVFAWAA